MFYLAAIAIAIATCFTAVVRGEVGEDPTFPRYHARPLKNWMNDPNGLMYFAGKYHLFMQYNPFSPTFGNISWYHMISEDLVSWKHLPLALSPDRSWECGGVFTGSATIYRNDTSGQDMPVLIFSTACGDYFALATPQNLSDPELVRWEKPSFDPLYKRPSGLSPGGFRDPTTAWQGSDGVWRMLMGCADSIGTCEFKSQDFIHWSYAGSFHDSGDDMWECPDFFNVPGTTAYVLKASTAGKDWWSLGSYSENTNVSQSDSFQATSGEIKVSGNLFDHGTFYASKSFFDPKKSRQVIFGWANLHCPGTDWAGMQTFPRSVELDPEDSTRIVTNPIEELKSLRGESYRSTTPKKLAAKTSSAVPLVWDGTQMEVIVNFTGGLQKGSTFGVRSLFPIKLPNSTIENEGVSTLIHVTGPGTAESSGASFKFPAEGPLTLRLLVDHSIVEAILQHGRAAITTPHCPPMAAVGIGLELINPGPLEVTVSSVEVYRLNDASTLYKVTNAANLVVV